VGYRHVAPLQESDVLVVHVDHVGRDEALVEAAYRVEVAHDRAVGGAEALALLRGLGDVHHHRDAEAAGLGPYLL
jgi:hypothetical protein